MFLNILGWLAMLGITGLFGWLVARAWRARSAFVKWGGTIFSGLLTLVVGLLAVIAAKGLYRIYAPPPFSPAPDINVAGAPDQLARGEHLVLSFCAGCHSPTGAPPLSGGVNIGQDSPVPIGELISFNLTPGGPLKDWSNGEIFRVIRQGVDQDGRRLITMSTLPVRNLSDDDIQAVIAFLRSQPAMPDPPRQGDYPNLLLALFAGANLVPASPEPVTGTIVAPPKAPTVEFGKYVISYNDCYFCHGADYTGGTPGGLSPVGPNLRVVKGWTREQFITTIRTGVDPSGRNLSTVMPWRTYRNMDDDELGGIYEYLHSLP